MITLALDTSTARGAVALLQDARSPAEITFLRGTMASSTDLQLFETIQRVLQQQRLSVHDIELVAVGVGPGSFTGIRVAIAAAKGLALPYMQPIEAVSSFDALALTVLPQMPKECVQMCIVGDARRNETYCTIYDRAGRCVSNCRITVLKRLVETINVPTWFISAEMERFGDALREFGNHFVHIARIASYPSATAVGELALRHIRDGAVCGRQRLEPIYLRAANYRKITDH